MRTLLCRCFVHLYIHGSIIKQNKKKFIGRKINIRPRVQDKASAVLLLFQEVTYSKTELNLKSQKCFFLSCLIVFYGLWWIQSETYVIKTPQPKFWFSCKPEHLLLLSRNLPDLLSFHACPVKCPCVVKWVSDVFPWEELLVPLLFSCYISSVWNITFVWKREEVWQ